MKKAIKELKNSGFNLEGLVKSYKSNNLTFIKDETLYYKNISEGLMALTHLKNDQELVFNNNFDNFAVMLDVSRGAVFQVSYLKRLIRSYAMMGINEVWLYMEDMYKLDSYPDFGYLRGSYQDEELRKIVDYANIFQIKIVPAIQTLGHMEQFLRWNNQIKIKDQSNVLLLRNEETYKLIDEMFKKLKDIFKHNKIHIGLDETWGLGFDNFYKQNGYIPQLELFFEHLEIVNSLALKNGFKEVLMWSDMPYRILSKNNNYYDENIVLDKEVIKRIPNNVKLVYWDYYNKDDKKVDHMIKNHLNISNNFCFASGTWIWTRFTYDKTQTDKTCKIHIEKAIENNVKDFVLTQWMDDGAYGDHESTLLGVYEMSIKALTNSQASKKAYHFITETKLEVSYNKAKLNDLKLSQVGIFWDDPQYGIYIDNYSRGDLNVYNDLLVEMNDLKKIYEDNEKYVFEYNILMANYYKVLGRKQMIENYLNKNKLNIENFFNKQISHLNELLKIHRNKWYKNNKTNGFEVIQSRIATQISRAEEMIILAKLYNEGKIKEIAGLKLEKQPPKQYIHLKHSHIAFTIKPFDA